MPDANIEILRMWQRIYTLYHSEVFFNAYESLPYGFIYICAQEVICIHAQRQSKMGGNEQAEMKNGSKN